MARIPNVSVEKVNGVPNICVRIPMDKDAVKDAEISKSGKSLVVANLPFTPVVSTDPATKLPDNSGMKISVNLIANLPKD